MTTSFFGSVADPGEGNTAAPSSFYKDSVAYENIVAPSTLVTEAEAAATTAAASATAAAASATAAAASAAAAAAVGAFANPVSPGVNLTGANGVAATAMRSDAVLTLSQAIVPTWTGAHTFTGNVNVPALRAIGSSSGTITIQPQAAAGTFNFNLPITAGTAGQVLASGGGGSTAMTWATAVVGPGSATDNAVVRFDATTGQLLQNSLVAVTDAGNLSVPASAYVNWGVTSGSGGYGLRDNAGSVEFKNSGGAWQALPVVGGGTVTITATPTTIGSTTSKAYFNVASAATITLPDAATWKTANAFAILLLKDISGAAQTNNITINRAGSDTIDGLTTFSITTNYGWFYLDVVSSNWTFVG